jgi:hypothetical protein
MAIRLYGMAEAERQIKIARRLSKEEQSKVRWDKLRNGNAAAILIGPVNPHTLTKTNRDSL